VVTNTHIKVKLTGLSSIALLVAADSTFTEGSCNFTAQQTIYRSQPEAQLSQNNWLQCRYHRYTKHLPAANCCNSTFNEHC